jgi:Cytochrome oxidase complex assembly protein 1
MSANPQSAIPAFQMVPPQSPKGWLARNWKWLVGGLFLVLVLLVAGIMTLVMGAMRGSDVATESVLRAQGNASVVQRLGAPIKEGWFVGGSINVSTASGDADLSVPISGPKGEATVYVTAQKTAGTWIYSQMVAVVKGSGDKIDLLSAATAAPGPAASEPRAQGSSGQAAASPAAGTPAETVANAGSPAADPIPGPAAAPDVIQSQDSNAPGTVSELIQCKRSEGVLSVKVRFRNTSAKTVEFAIFRGGNSEEREKAYVTAASKKYFILKDSAGQFLTSPSDYCGVCVRLEAGQSFTWWAKFPAPPDEVKKVNLMTPITSPFEDVPVTDK